MQCKSPVHARHPLCHRSALVSAAAAAAGKAPKFVGDVRPVPIKIVTVAKGNSKGAELLVEEWSSKLKRYTAVTEVNIKPNPKRNSTPELQKEAEADKVLKALSPSDRVILLDERGKAVTSEQIAQLLAAAGEQGAPCLAFCVGGPFGHGPQLAARAHDSISLSRCVLNHAVAHVVLVEQLYRAWTILRNEPYHH